jgi:hypothetical protein
VRELQAFDHVGRRIGMRGAVHHRGDLSEYNTIVLQICKPARRSVSIGRNMRDVEARPGGPRSATCCARLQESSSRKWTARKRECLTIRQCRAGGGWLFVAPDLV